VPLWQIDCEEYRKVGGTFELRDVATQEHEDFVRLFATRHKLAVTRTGPTVIFKQLNVAKVGTILLAGVLSLSARSASLTDAASELEPVHAVEPAASLLRRPPVEIG
jgi:hypothetical protein